MCKCASRLLTFGDVCRCMRLTPTLMDAGGTQWCRLVGTWYGDRVGEPAFGVPLDGVPLDGVTGGTFHVRVTLAC